MWTYSKGVYKHSPVMINLADKPAPFVFVHKILLSAEEWDAAGFVPSMHSTLQHHASWPTGHVIPYEFSFRRGPWSSTDVYLHPFQYFF